MLTLYQRNAEHVSRETARSTGYAERSVSERQSGVRADRSEVMKGVVGLPIDPMCGRGGVAARYRRPSVLSSFVRLHWQRQEPPGPSTPLPTYPAGNPRWFGHPLSGQEGQITAVVIDHQ